MSIQQNPENTVKARVVTLSDGRCISAWKYDDKSYGFKFEKGESAQYIRLTPEAIVTMHIMLALHEGNEDVGVMLSMDLQDRLEAAGVELVASDSSTPSAGSEA